jgi:putative flippase GtrA
VGGFAFLVEFASIFLTHEVLKMQLVESVWISIAIGFSISFSGHLFVTFRRKSGFGPSLVGYVLLATLNSLISVNLILLISGFTGWEIAKIVTSALFVAWNFFAYRVFVFRGLTASELLRKWRTFIHHLGVSK